MNRTSSSSLDQLNSNNTAIKRLMKEFSDMQKDPSAQYEAHPLQTNVFEWHFTIRGPSQTEFEGGIYHGRILFPYEYPFKPPSILLLTPNGRFEVNKKICLSISNYHPEYWQPSWSVRTVLVAIRAFMPTEGKGAIGAIDYSPEERKKLAAASTKWVCTACGTSNADVFANLPNCEENQSNKVKQEEEAAKEICFSSPKPAPEADPASVSNENLTGSSPLLSSSSSTNVKTETTLAGIQNTDALSTSSSHSLDEVSNFVDEMNEVNPNSANQLKKLINNNTTTTNNNSNNNSNISNNNSNNNNNSNKKNGNSFDDDEIEPKISKVITSSSTSPTTNSSVTTSSSTTTSTSLRKQESLPLFDLGLLLIAVAVAVCIIALILRKWRLF